MVGGLIMGHGDDKGLRVPPALAATQAVVLLVKDEDGAGDAATKLASDLRAAGVRVELDARVATSFGRRATDWEIKGVPVRVEVGPRNLAEGNVTVVRRDTNEKQPVAVGDAPARVASLLAEVQQSLYDQALARREANTVDVASVDDALEAAATGFARLPWSAVGAAGEDRLAQAAVTVRCLQRADGGVPESEDEPDLVAIVGRSY
jgi:prolyl-tRNA synthetase